jgi:hypothetical protein
MTARYLVPNNQPPSRADYDELYAQFIALILSTGKTTATVPHSIKHPANLTSGVLIVEKKVDSYYTTYTIVAQPPPPP